MLLLLLLLQELFGYFDLNFNFEEVDVSFDYSISVTINENSRVSDLIMTNEPNDDPENPQVFYASPYIINGHINYEDNVTSKLVRVYVKWDDSISATMDNAADTQATFNTIDSETLEVILPLALLDVKVTFTQTATPPTP